MRIVIKRYHLATIKTSGAIGALSYQGNQYWEAVYYPDKIKLRCNGRLRFPLQAPKHVRNGFNIVAQQIGWRV